MCPSDAQTTPITAEIQQTSQMVQTLTAFFPGLTWSEGHSGPQTKVNDSNTEVRTVGEHTLLPSQFLARLGGKLGR